MEQYQTETGRREDLEQIEVNPDIGFIGNRIYPVENKMTETGTLYYRTLTADASAETGRSAGTAPSRTLLTDSNTSFTAAEVIKRYGVERHEVKQMGGIEAADRLGAKASKRSVLRAQEEAIADDVLLNSSATIVDIMSSLTKAVQTGIEAIRRYPGKTAFVCSTTVFNRIMRYSEITNRFDLASAVLQGANARDVITRKPEALRMALGGMLGVDEVLVGDDDQWYDSDANKQERAALVKLPDPMEFSQKMDPVFGKMIQYLPDGKQPFMLESFYDDDDKVNNYDAYGYYDLITFNTGALYLLKGIDEGNATTTTTTTTT